MLNRLPPVILLILCLFFVAIPSAPAQSTIIQPQLPPSIFSLSPAPIQSAALQPQLPPSIFGLNMYITGRERSDQEARALINLARRIGAD
jgi:hypothetical protein